MFTITSFFLLLLELTGRNGMFMNFLETCRNFFYRRSWKPVEHSVMSKNILEYLEALRNFKKFMELSGLRYFWYVIEHLEYS